MTAIYRGYEIIVTKESARAYFIVLRPNGSKLISGFLDFTDSLVNAYRDVRSRIDLELL